MDTITTDKDIAASAKRRAESTVKHSHRYGTVIAAICAAAVMCTTVVSAVKFGWLNDLLGTASYSEDAFAQVDVSMKDVHLNKGENAPSDMDFRLLDAVSDGQSLIINYELSGTFDEEITEQLFYHSAKINDDTTRFGYSTKISSRSSLSRSASENFCSNCCKPPPGKPGGGLLFPPDGAGGCGRISGCGASGTRSTRPLLP